MNSISSDPKQLMETLYHEMEEIIRDGEEEREGLPRLEYLAESLEKLVAPILAIGTDAHQRLEEGSDRSLRNFLLCFEWADCAKSFLILYRDVLFQEQKAWLQVSSKVTDLATYRRLLTQSDEVLREAHAEFRHFLEREVASASSAEKRISKWTLQDNPWPVYRQQISLFADQAKDLLAQCKSLWNTSGLFVVIYSHVTESFATKHKEVDQLYFDIQSLIATVEKEESYPAKNVTTTLDTLYHRLIDSGGLAKFNQGLDEHLDKLPEEIKVFVSADSGTMYYKDLELQKMTRSWLESEVMSEIYELNAIKESIQNKVNLTKVNLGSRSGEEEKNISSKENILSALQMFLRSLDKSRQKVEALENHVRQKLTKDFDLTGVYSDSFLPVSIQYTLKQYQQGERFKVVKDWLDKQGRVLKQLRRNVREESALSLSEKIVRSVKDRTCLVENSHYTNMFLTKGYIGDSFLVGRKAELKHIASIVENWKLGFRGGIMITGKRFSGKTLLGELIGQKYFPQQMLRIQPETKIQIAGRHFNGGFDLREILDFVVKNTLNQPMMVWIDDLELWENEKKSLGENVRALLNTIDQFTGRLFFVVACSNWMKDHLQRIFEVDKIFQSEINIDRMKVEEIQTAILTRHSATHMELVDVEEKEEISPQELRKRVNQIYRSAHGNIGEALQVWAYSIYKYDDEKVMLKDTAAYSLPSFLSADSSLLLRAIMMEKRTNEYRLHKQFGPAFNDKYKVVLQRLSSLGIVQRSINGWLEINPVLVNDIGAQLERVLNFRFANKAALVEDLKL